MIWSKYISQEPITDKMFKNIYEQVIVWEVRIEMRWKEITLAASNF